MTSAYSEDIQLEAGIEALDFSSSGSEVSLKLSDGSAYLATDFVSALPSHELARLLKPHDPKVAELLQSIEFANVAVVTMTFNNHGDEANVIPKHLHGFGYLVPPKYQEPVLGVVFDSLTFPQQQADELTRITVMIGGDRTNHSQVPDVTAMLEADLVAISRDAIRRHLGIAQEPETALVKICNNAIAQYTVGHEKKVASIVSVLADKYPALKIAGSSYFGVGVNDCITNAFNVIEKSLFKHL